MGKLPATSIEDGHVGEQTEDAEGGAVLLLYPRTSR